MKDSAKVDSSVIPSIPVFICVIGAAITALVLGADLVGLRDLIGYGSVPATLLWTGLVALALGASWDLALGKRKLLDWLKSLELDLQNLVKFATVALQLGLVVLVAGQFHLVSSAFYNNVMLLTFFGFVINQFVPQPNRLSFFLILSVCAITGVFGFSGGAWIIGIGLTLIGICHLPLPFPVRTMILVAAGAVVIALRTEILPSFLSQAIWPVIGSMFMFRLLIYYYDVRHKKAPASISRSLSYFFLLPNVAFPLFPAIDYTQFCRTYYNDNSYRIYQRGINTIFRGVLHLLLYRVINHYFVIAGEDVTTLTSLAHYMIASYLLVLRISGQFHMIVGILQLFGFNLPRVMDFYWLSSSFNDYWRRINIYWKDFIVKVFYYPAYFRMRKLGNTTKLILATLFGFFITWFFHTFQWFWIQGTFPLSLPSILHWGTLGILVLANSLYETKYGRKPVESARSLKYLLGRTFRVLGTISVVCVLYSLWISPSLDDWLSLWSFTAVTLADALNLVLVLLGAAAVILVASFVFERSSLGATANKGKSTPLPFFKAASVTGVSILMLLLIGKPQVTSQFSLGAQEIIRDLRIARLSAPDVDLLSKGYYENLMFVNRFNSQLFDIYMKRPDTWGPLRQTDAGRHTNDFLGYELVPMSSIMFHSAPFTTNRWGMRDKDYEKKKPQGTCRIALLGASGIMGNGVADGEAFECVLEDRLNLENQGGTQNQYEILNFAVDAYSALQQLKLVEDKVLSFEPDILFYTVTTRAERNLVRHLARMVVNGVDIPYDYLRRIVRKSKADKGRNYQAIFKRLRPHGKEILSYVFERISAMCRERNIVPVCIYYPLMQKVENVPEMAAQVRSQAEQAGFVVIDMSGLWENADIESLRVAEWDWHFNAEGHRMMADRLYQELHARKDAIPLRLPAWANGTSNGVVTQ